MIYKKISRLWVIFSTFAKKGLQMTVQISYLDRLFIVLLKGEDELHKCGARKHFF